MKSLRSSFFLWVTLSLTPLVTQVQAAEILSLDNYLTQVRGKNTGIHGSQAISDGGLLRSEEGQLLLAPTAFISAQFTQDSRLNPPVFIPYDSTTLTTLSFGISKMTSFGLQGRLRYDMSTFGYVNPVISPTLAAFAGAIPLNVANASPVLELSQSLWGNGFGRSTRAQQELLEANALSQSYAAKFQVKTQVLQAERAYWRLALARQSIAVQSEALDRAQKIYDWTVKQAKLHLRENSDVLQAEALKQSRVLDLAVSKNEEKSAARAFNSSRNVESEDVPEKLAELQPTSIEGLSLPTKAELRDDVRSAKEASRAAMANATVNQEKSSPTLELYASLALNGQRGTTIFANLSDAISNSFTFNRPTETIGVRFVAPLDLGVVSRSKDGWAKEQAGADLTYQRRLFEQEQNWKDLAANYSNAKIHLDLSVQLESIQKSKLSNERERLLHGRATTYQVLLFEQDYLLSQLTRIRSQGTVLNLLAEMKLFGDSL
ncbi:MAG: TolC family protein [Bdellovibrio sp.]|nr:TolC family protein [Bdellovibrio sp.]